MENKKKIFKKAKYITILVIIVLIGIVVFQNIAPIDLQLFFYTFEVSKALVIGVSALIGFLIGMLVSMSHNKRKRNL